MSLLKSRKGRNLDERDFIVLFNMRQARDRAIVHFLLNLDERERQVWVRKALAQAVDKTQADAEDEGITAYPL